MTKHQYVALNDVEQRLVKTVAVARYDNARAKGVPKTFVAYEDGYVCDIDGFGGELAFCKLFNVYPDMSIRAWEGEQDEGDCVWNGLRIDVKTTTYPEGCLLAGGWKKLNVDYYALMTGVFPNYYYRGVMRADKLLQQERLTDFGYREPAYRADQDELIELTKA